jgi:hypothetical protein
MNRFWKKMLFLLFGVSLLCSAANAQKPPGCDCSHFPILTQCESRCGMTSGKITEVTNSTVVVEKQSTSDNVSAKKTFKLGPATKKNGVLKQGAPVTVYYHQQGNVAEQIDVIDALKGLLVPGNDPDPPLPEACLREPVPQNAIRVYLGSTAAGLSTSDEVTVLTVGESDILDVRRTPKGLAINAKTFSQDGKIIAQITDNQFYINPNNFFRMDKPDTHSMIVYDLQGRKVLDVRYINSHSVKVLGIFQVPGAPVVDIEESVLFLAGSSLRNTCFSGTRLIKIGL